MKVSVVVPVYNGEVDVGECLDALIGQDYHPQDYEIVAVDDGSTDNTANVLLGKRAEAERNGISMRVIKLGKRQGRFLARKNGAKMSRYENVLFVDSRVIPEKQLLRKFRELGYQPVVGNVVMIPDRSVYDYFFHLIRRKLYWHYYGEKFPPVYITEESFSSKIPKGTGVFLCNKSLFLETTEEIGEIPDRKVSDDTRLLRGITGKRRILKHSNPRVYYKTRIGLRENFVHMFNRGSKFSDFYLSRGGPFLKYLSIGLPVVYLLLLMSLFFPEIMLVALAVTLGILEVSLTKIFCRSWKDAKIFIPYNILFGFAFFLGILRAKLKIFAVVLFSVIISWSVIFGLM